MKVLARAGAFLALVAGVLGVSAVVGSQIGLEVAREPDPAPAPPPAEARPRGANPISAPPVVAALPDPDAGLSVESRGLRLVVAEPAIEAEEPTTVRFRLLGGEVRRVAATVVRRDARFLQRPAVRREGGSEWAVDLRVPRAGTYRLIVETDRGRHVVGTDLFAPGEFEPMPMPPPADVSSVDGFDVRARWAGRSLAFDVSRRGRRVAARADGPLVAVRAGDMAYAAGRPRGGALRFGVRFPGPGRYRLFVPFEERGDRHVAAFTWTGRR